MRLLQVTTKVQHRRKQPETSKKRLKTPVYNQLTFDGYHRLYQGTFLGTCTLSSQGVNSPVSGLGTSVNIFSASLARQIPCQKRWGAPRAFRLRFWAGGPLGASSWLLT